MIWIVLSLTLTAGPDDVATPKPEQPDAGVPLQPDDRAEIRRDMATQQSRLRLLDIETELSKLRNRPTGGEVFATNLKRVAPWMGIGLIPLAGGLAVGWAGQSLTVPLTFSQALVYPVVGIGGFAVVGLIVVLFSVVEHYINEADEAPARDRRVDALLSERANLQLQF